MKNMQTPPLQAKITVENIRDNLEKLNYSTSEIKLNRYNYEFNVNQNKSSIKILVYFGSKGIKTILQGSKSQKIYKEIDSIINGTFNFDEIEIVQSKEYIGSDESGKGDFFGPLIVCAFAYDNSIENSLKKLNVRDSKEIYDEEILIIYNKLLKDFKDRIEVVEIHPKKYNQLYEKIPNLNKILIWSHTKAINNLLNNFDYNTVIIDKFTSEKSFIGKLSITKKLILEEKAERFLGVAAASIIARARLILWFNKNSDKLGLKIPFGAGQSVTKFAEEIEKKDKNLLTELIKLHFKNFKDLNK